MAVLAIELNDVGIRAVRDSSHDLLAVDGRGHASPGIARVQKKEIVTGLAAARQSCAHPLEVDSRFWERLDTEPSSPRLPRSPNRAEVALAHLTHVLDGVREPDDTVVIAVPPAYDTRQLGMIVAMMRELGVPLAGLVASPIAIDHDAVTPGPALVVDLGLHQCGLSRLDVGDETRLESTRTWSDIGWLSLQRQWVKTIGDLFVRTTRFDPLHDAATEQQLADAVPEVLDGVADAGRTEVVLRSGPQTHRVSVERDQLAHAGHGLLLRWCKEIRTASRGATAVLLTHDSARVPGLLHMLGQQVTVPVHELPAGAAALGLQRTWPGCFQTVADGVAYFTCRDAATPAAASGAEPMIKRRRVNAFSTSFLDCICCGFGAVILLFVIINARSAVTRNERVMDLRGEVSRLEFEVLKGEKNLVQARNALDETIEELVRTEGRSREIIEQIKKIDEELSVHSETTLATKEHINKLKADLKSLEEESKRLKAAVDADQEGEKLREFKGAGDRHYLTGLKVGGARILILADCSASMLGETVIDVIRRRNMSNAEKQRSAKWMQSMRTVDWLSTQLPATAKFQIYGFNEKAFASAKGTGGTWLDAGNPDHLAQAVDGLKQQIPGGGTSLHQAFAALRAMPTRPDNVILLTDGLPTMARSKPIRYKVSAKKRFDLFRSAVSTLPGDIPVNVILLPMEGDPLAARAFWRLAINTRGSYMCPSKDWP